MKIRILLTVFAVFATLPGLAIAHDYKVGDLVVMSPWARATAGHSKNGVAYLRIINNGHHADRLVGARTDRAAMVQLHTVVMKDGMMTMRQIEAVDVPPRKATGLQPGGDHLMLMGLIEPLREGETFKLELTFAKSGALSIEVAVAGVGSMEHPHDGGGGRQSETGEQAHAGTRDEAHDAHGAQGMAGTGMQADLDTSTSKMSEHHRFQVSVESQETPLPLNVMHAWVLTVTTPDGQAIDGAKVIVDGGMPAHGHGLPTAPRVTKNLGEGRYLVEGMKFNMSGRWEITFTIAKGSDNDRVTFNLILQ